MKTHVKKKSGERPAVAAPATWLEHMESEIEVMCRADKAEDLELLLKNSPDDAAILESLKRVRAAVKQSDDVALPESGEYYDQLHAKIMAAIEADAESDADADADADAVSVPKSHARVLSWPNGFRLAGFAMMIAMISLVALRQTPFNSATTEQTTAQAVGESYGRSVASVNAHAGADLAKDLGSFESEEDFVTEAAEARLQQVSKHDAEAMISSLKM